MNIKSLSYTLIKILSIWIFVFSVLPSLLSIITFLSPSDDENYYSLIYYLFVTVCYIIISLTLWFTANNFSAKISSAYKFEESTVGESVLREAEIIEIGLILIGFYAIIYSIPAFINLLIRLLSKSLSGSEIYSVSYIDLVQYLLNFIIATYFIIGREKLSQWVLKLRNAGVKKSD